MHTLSPAKAWTGGLSALRKPLLHFHTQINVSLPWGEIDMDFMNLNQAAHGDREFGYIETRMGIPRKTVVGHASDPAARADRDLDAGGARTPRARSLRMARFGDNMRDVAVTEGDKVEAQIKLGISVSTYGVNDLVAAVDGASTDEVDAIADAYESSYAVVDDLARGCSRCVPASRRSGRRASFTTHADLSPLPVPLARDLTAIEIRDGYEEATGHVLVEAVGEHGAVKVPGVLARGHGVFAWGRDALNAVEIAVTIEEVARLAALTLALAPHVHALPADILDEHYERKHGPHATYGQRSALASGAV